MKTAHKTTQQSCNHMIADDIRDLVSGCFESNRRLSRVTSACLLAAETQMGFPEAYRAVLIAEKEQLLAVLKHQLQQLNSLKTPAAILKDKEHDVKLVSGVVNRLKKQKASRIAANLARELQKESERDAINLTTSFVDTAACMSFMERRGRAAVKALLVK